MQMNDVLPNLLFWMSIHKCIRQFRQSDWTKHGCVLTDGIDMYFTSVLCVPKTRIGPFLFGFNQQKLYFVHFENKIDMDIYE